jgi:hypothetical protein
MESNTFKWEYYLVVNWKEIIQDNISAKITNEFNMHSCSNKYWYSYTWNDWWRYFIFDWITYWGSSTKHINNYGYTQSNCEPIFVSISNDDINSLYPWFGTVSQSNTSISRVKTHEKDIYYLKYKYPSWYQLFKNKELIEWRWWVIKYWFDSKWELNYWLRIRDQTGVDKIIIHDSKWEYIFNWYTHIDRFEQYENDNYIYAIRWASEDLVLNWKKTNNPWKFYKWDYKNGKFFSIYKEDDSKYSIYIDNNKVELTEWKINLKDLKNDLLYRIKDDNRDKAVVQCG